MRWPWLPLLFAVALPVGSHAAPIIEFASFDVDGDGTTSRALRVREVGSAVRGSLHLGQRVQLEADRTYCARFHIAIVNEANTRAGRFRFRIDVDGHASQHLTEVPQAGAVLRDIVRTVFVAGSSTETQICIEMQHDTGPESDPVLYVDRVELVPLQGTWMDERYEQQVWMDGATVVGWDHDFGLRGVTATDYVGVAQVELVVWDDEPSSNDGLEWIELTVNGTPLPGLDITGSVETPYHLRYSFPWLECRTGFDGRFEMRLRTVPTGSAPPGDMFFGAATTTLHVGQFEGTILENGEFEHDAQAWAFGTTTCGTTSVQSTTWSAFKQRYRAGK